MKRILVLIFGFVIFGVTPETNAFAENSQQATTYIIPVKGPIEKGLLYVVRRGLSEAQAAKASAVIFHMDTHGGAVSITEEIIRMMIDLPGNIQTYTLIDKDALSAGAMISLSTSNIYMTPGSRIGASAVITPFGDLPEGDTKEKVVSSTIALVRSAAVRNGHDPDIAAAMMRRDFEYKIGDKIISPKGKLLTLTSIEATQMIQRNNTNKTLLASGIVTNMPGLLKQIGRDNTKVVTLEQSWAEQMARWIQMLGALFLIGGLVGIYVEIKVPGFGLPGILGVACLIIFFWGHYVAGLTGFGEIVIFLIGMILILLEIFVIPGFGLAGISGMILVISALLFAMVQNYPGNSWFNLPSSQLQRSIVALGLALMGSVGFTAILAKYLPKTRALGSVFLSSSVSRQEGYSSSDETSELVGSRGYAASALRPAGIGIFKHKRLDVVARGSFIDKNRQIVIAETHGNRIIVDEIQDQPT